MNLPIDLQRILNVNAKVYNTESKRQGKVILVTDELVTVDYGSKVKPDTFEYDIDEFKALLLEDIIVANSRLGIDKRDNYFVKPRPNSIQVPERVLYTSSETITAETPKVTQSVNSSTSPEVELSEGYINFSTGKFSDKHQKGFTKVLYKKVIEKVTLEVDSEMMERLKELGLV